MFFFKFVDLLYFGIGGAGGFLVYVHMFMCVCVHCVWIFECTCV